MASSKWEEPGPAGLIPPHEERTACISSSKEHKETGEMREVEEAKGELSHFRYSGARGSKGPHHGSALDRGAATPLPNGGHPSLAPQSPRQELPELPAALLLCVPQGEGVLLWHSVFLHSPRGKRVLPGSWGAGRGTAAWLTCTELARGISHKKKLTLGFLSNADGPTSTRRPRSTKSSAFSRAGPPGIPRRGRRTAWTVCLLPGRPRSSTAASAPPQTFQVTPISVGPSFSL